MYPVHPYTATTGAPNAGTTIAASGAATAATAMMPVVRTAEPGTCLLKLPNEIIFQMLVHLSRGGYSDFFPALSNLAQVSRRTAELVENTASWIVSKHKPSDADNFWWWTKLQNVVSRQVHAGIDPHRAVSAGLNRLLKPGMHLVPLNGEILDTILAVKHATLPCSTITFDIPGLAAVAAMTRPAPGFMAPWDRIAFLEEARFFEERALGERISRFLLEHAQMAGRPQALVKWCWDTVEGRSALRALGCAAAKYEKAFLMLESSDRSARQSGALIDALKSGKVVSVDLNVRSMNDDVARELIQSVRQANSVQHLRIHYFAYAIDHGRPNWADLLPELNGHASLRKLTVLYSGPVEGIRGHLENLPDCPRLETVAFHISVPVVADVADESRQMRELVDAIRPAGKDRFSVSFVVGTGSPANEEI